VCPGLRRGQPCGPSAQQLQHLVDAHAALPRLVEQPPEARGLGPALAELRALRGELRVAPGQPRVLRGGVRVELASIVGPCNSVSVSRGLALPLLEQATLKFRQAAEDRCAGGIRTGGRDW